LIAEKYGFTDIQYKLFYRTRTFSAKEYIMLLGTYSDHIAIEETIRNEFFSKIEEAINRHGGEITIYDTIDLQLARKI
ncbi:MAG: class I SAM-dependent methyltransferase, partial [Clostridia bacterium]|nr:class I SAM-dependent methyltransferase [Clostridia bacterium]